MRKTTLWIMLSILIATGTTFLGISLKTDDREVTMLHSTISQQAQQIADQQNQLKFLSDSNEELRSQINQKSQLEKDYAWAMSNALTTSDMVNVCASFGDRWKLEMDKYYKLLYNELDKDKKQWLVSSQKKWEDYTEDNEELAWQTYDQIHHGGSIMALYSAQIYLERYETRAKTLINLYNALS